MAIEKITVARDDRIYELLPDMVRLPNAKIVLTNRESEGHRVYEFSAIVVRTSVDDGHTWSPKRTIVASKKNKQGVVTEWNLPRVQRLSDGRLLLLCDSFPVPPGEESDLSNAHVTFWWSDDEGETWSEPQQTSVVGICPDKLIELPSGAWLLSTTVHMKNGKYDIKGNETQIVHRSEDKGQTWHGPIVVGADERYHLSEGSIVLLPDGELVCYLREELGYGGFKSFSKDEGRTWEGPYKTVIDGIHDPVAGLLPGDRVMVTYRYQQRGTLGSSPPWAPKGSSGQVMNYTFAGKGQTAASLGSFWARNTMAYLETVESAKARDIAHQGGIILPLDHDRSPRSDGGYTSWVLLDNGKIFCVNYVVDDAPMAFIRGYWFDFNDF